MIDILSAAQTAKIIGCSAQKVREKIKRKKWPGEYIPKKESGCKLDRYEINIQELSDFLKITREEAERRLRA